MAIFLARRWRQQPQGPVAVDWSHPSSRGLVLAWIGSQFYVNLATGQRLVENDANFPGKRQSGKYGLGYWTDQGGAGSTQYLPVLPASQVPAGRDASVTLGYRKSDSTLRGSSGFGTADGAPYSFQAHLPWSDGTVYWDYGSERHTASGLTFGDDVWTFQADANGLHIVQNGVRTYGGPAATNRSANTNPLYIGRGLSAPDVAVTSFMYVHNRGLSSAEWVALYEHPYQIFRPVQRTFFSLPSTVRVLKTHYITSANATSSITLTEAERAGMGWPARIRLRLTSMNAADVPSSVVGFPMIQRGRWRQQPQRAVEVDWSHPLLRGAVSVLTTHRGQVEVLTPYSREATNVAPISAAMNGARGAQFNGSTSYWTDSRPVEQVLTGADKMSRLAVVRLTGSGGTLSTTRTDGFNGAQFRVFTASSNNAIDFVASGNFVIAAGGNIAAGEQAVVAVTYDDPAARLFKNGALIVSANQTASFSSSVALFGARSTVPQEVFDGALALHVDWARTLSDAEVAEMSANPWQIFRPRRWPF